jgi:hypothetical protein
MNCILAALRKTAIFQARTAFPPQRRGGVSRWLDPAAMAKSQHLAPASESRQTPNFRPFPSVIGAGRSTCDPYGLPSFAFLPSAQYYEHAIW